MNIADIEDTADTVDTVYVADTVDTVDTVETADPDQIDRELGWITKIPSYMNHRTTTSIGL